MGQTPNGGLKLIDYDGGLALSKDFNENMIIIDDTIRKVNEISSDDTINYYVNGTTGDDNNDGLTEATAWKSLGLAVKTLTLMKNLYSSYDLTRIRPNASYLTNLKDWEPWTRQIPHYRINLSEGVYFSTHENILLKENPCIEIKGTLVDPILTSGGPISGITTAVSGGRSVNVDFTTGTPWADSELEGLMIKFEGNDLYYPIRDNILTGSNVEIFLPYYQDRTTVFPSSVNFTIHDFGSAIWFAGAIKTLEGSLKIYRNSIRHCNIPFLAARFDCYECKVQANSTSGETNFTLCYMWSSSGCKGRFALMCIFKKGRFNINQSAHCIFDCYEARIVGIEGNSNQQSKEPSYLYCWFYGTTIVGKSYAVQPLRGGNIFDWGLFNCYFYDDTKIVINHLSRAFIYNCYFKDTFLGFEIKECSTLRVEGAYNLDTGALIASYVFDIESGSKVIYKGSSMPLSGSINDYRINPAVVGNFASGLLDFSNGCLIQEITETY